MLGVLAFSIALAAPLYATPIFVDLNNSAGFSQINFAKVLGNSYVAFNGFCSPFGTLVNECVHGTGTLQGTSNPTAPSVSYDLWLTPSLLQYPKMTGPAGSTITVAMNGETLHVLVCASGGCSIGQLGGTITLLDVLNATTSTPGISGLFTVTGATGEFAPYWPSSGNPYDSAFTVSLDPTHKTPNQVYTSRLAADTGGPLSGVIAGTTVPEPGTMMLFGTSMLGLSAIVRRRLGR
jgi:hypothetical protein